LLRLEQDQPAVQQDQLPAALCSEHQRAGAGAERGLLQPDRFTVVSGLVRHASRQGPAERGFSPQQSIADVCP